MTTELEIQEIIKKSLPAQVGEVLKQRLEQADKDAKEVENLRKNLILEKNAIRDLSLILEDYRKFDDRNSKLEIKEKEVAEKEFNLKVATLETQLASEKEKSEFAKSIGLGLVRNIEYRRSLFDNQNGPDGRDQYGNIMYSNKTQNSTETKIAE